MSKASQGKARRNLNRFKANTSVFPHIYIGRCTVTNKCMYLTRKYARRAARDIHPSEVMSAYHCEYCNYFHYGHTPKNRDE